MKSQIHKIINDKLEIAMETSQKKKRLRDGFAKHLANKIENKEEKGLIYKNLIFQTLASEERETQIDFRRPAKSVSLF